MEKYYVLAVKATRKPLLLAAGCSKPVAYTTADNYYQVWRKLGEGDLTASGVSIRVYDYDASNIELGDPDFVLGKPAVMSWGSI